VRFSDDGIWVAFGHGQVMAASGGPVLLPFGAPVESWQWSPKADVMAAVTRDGGVQISPPDGLARTIVRNGSGVSGLAFSPDGASLALARAGVGVQVLSLNGRRPRTVLPVAGRAEVPRLAGWSAEGGWILYWPGPLTADDAPLNAVRVSGGGWVNLWGHVLPYPEFLSQCGHAVAITAGSGAALSVGKQIFLSTPPAWRPRDLSADPTRSWFWPACSPSGRWVAATDSLSEPETSGQTVPRALWLLAANGSSRRMLVPGFHGSPEFPRWSTDGTVILAIVRQGTQWASPGSLMLVQINPRSGRLVRRVGPVADLGSAAGPGGHQRWASMSDWFSG